MKDVSLEEIMINGEVYVKKGAVSQKAQPVGGMEYVLIRTYSAGVHIGYLKSRDGKEVELVKARRVYYWDGAATLSQLAQSGTTLPSKCKFPEAVDSIILTEAIEIIPISEKAKKTIDSVAVWSK